MIILSFNLKKILCAIFTRAELVSGWTYFFLGKK
jgi:hypothetical protein